MSPDESSERTLRPGSAVAAGAIGAIAVLIVLVPSLLHDPRDWTLIGWLVLALVLLWLFVVRPCVRLHDEGLRIVNPLRTTDITWPMITEVRTRWLLEVLHDSDRYAAWGVPSDPGRPRYGRGMFNLGASKLARYTKETPKPRAKVTAQFVAAEIDERRTADRRRKDGRTPHIIARSWDPLSVGLLLAGGACWAITVFVL